jgi:hypothetical protein
MMKMPKKLETNQVLMIFSSSIALFASCDKEPPVSENNIVGIIRYYF